MSKKFIWLIVLTCLSFAFTIVGMMGIKSEGCVVYVDKVLYVVWAAAAPFAVYYSVNYVIKKAKVYDIIYVIFAVGLMALVATVVGAPVLFVLYWVDFFKTDRKEENKLKSEDNKEK